VKGHTQIGRLSMRHEGDNWVAYYALPESMDDAIMLGSIRMRIATVEARKEAFMALMRDAVSDIIETETGIRPEWGGAKPAPEHERSGSA